MRRHFDGSVQEAFGILIGRQQRMNFAQQFCVNSAGLIDERFALLAWQFHRGVENLLDLLPSLFVHRIVLLPTSQCWRIFAQLPIQPRPGQFPLARHCAFGNPERFGSFRDGQAAEKSHLDYSALALIELG